MNRCLHITIHDASGQAPRRSRVLLPGGAGGFDPDTPLVMPDPDDPETSYVMPDPDDPETSVVMPDPDDPVGPRRLRTSPRLLTSLGAAAPVVEAEASGCGCCCAGGARPVAPQPPRLAALPGLRSGDFSGFVILRLAEGVDAGAYESLWELATAEPGRFPGLKAILEPAREEREKPAAKAAPKHQDRREPPGVLVSRPLIELDGLSRLEAVRCIRRREARAARQGFPPPHSLAAYWRVDARPRADLLEELVRRCNELAEVAHAYAELAAGDANGASDGQAFAEDQGYLAEAPSGIGATWARTCLQQGPQLTVVDLEQGWNPAHLELASHVPATPLWGVNRADDEEGYDGHHGTAVLGQLAAAGKNPHAIRGAVADVARFAFVSHYRSRQQDTFGGTTGHVPAAILHALERPVTAAPPGLKAGDVLLLEVQRGKGPTELDEADLLAIRLAVAAGVIVVEAAGNGGFDLDAFRDPGTGRTLRRGDPSFLDSGAILVGAARASVPHDRLPYSCHGSRVDCFGWGEGVTTCGYGDLFGEAENEFYTSRFSGTSSASPIIAGAAALLQAIHRSHAGEPIKPLEMRALLSDPATGTGQGPNVGGFIGVMPDLRAIARARLQLVSDVYLRRRVGDDGSLPATGDELTSSPDIFLAPAPASTAPPANLSSQFGEGSLRENLPAPGLEANAGTPQQGPAAKLWVRLRNRGGALGQVRVKVFAGAAATLLAAHHWRPLGELDVANIPVGDTLHLAGPFPAPGSMTTPEGTAWSFLAVIDPPGERRVLPPGPPYFDWSSYLSFLRGPGVAIRNVHQIVLPSSAAAPVQLPFLITGTPDRTRRFDFEVLERLPAGTAVDLSVPTALAAKLRQGQPWLGGGGNTLSLPQRPRTPLRRVSLAPETQARASFAIVPNPKHPLRTGHSIAFRQLWRGEEVGRVTWYFRVPGP